MKSDELKRYIEEGGCNAEEYCFMIFIEKDILNGKTSYEDVVSFIMPKLMEFCETGSEFSTGEKIELVSKEHHLYFLPKGSEGDFNLYFEPIEEGFINNPQEVKNLINYEIKLRKSQHVLINSEEEKYGRFPYVKGLCEFCHGEYVYKDGNFKYIKDKDRDELYDNIFVNGKEYILVCVIDFSFDYLDY